MNDKGSPCLDCKDRLVGCHSKCEVFKNWKSRLETKQQVIRKAKQKTNGHYYFSGSDTN